MPSSRKQPLPIEAVRDLLGIARALYASEKAAGAGQRKLAQLAAAGRDLTDALELARSTEPDTVGHRAAWAKAERALDRLADHVNSTTELAQLAAAGRRVRG